MLLLRRIVRAPMVFVTSHLFARRCGIQKQVDHSVFNFNTNTNTKTGEAVEITETIDIRGGSRGVVALFNPSHIHTHTHTFSTAGE